MTERAVEQTEIQWSSPPALSHEDMKRIGKQRAAVRDFMAPGEWRTLAEIEDATGHPQASISARLRDFRRPKFGGHTVERRLRSAATWEYRLVMRDALSNGEEGK